MYVKLLNEYHLEFLSITGGCTGLSEATLVKMQHCWKSHVAAQILIFMARTHKMIVRIANREDPDQSASKEAV